MWGVEGARGVRQEPGAAEWARLLVQTLSSAAGGQDHAGRGPFSPGGGHRQETGQRLGVNKGRLRVAREPAVPLLRLANQSNGARARPDRRLASLPAGERSSRVR